MSSFSRLFRVFLMKHCSSTMRCVTILAISFLVLVGLKNVEAMTPQAIGPGYSQRNVEYRGCVMPKQPIGGKFEIDSCTGGSCNRTSEGRVASGTFLALRCHKGYALRGSKFTACRRDEWYLPPTCVKTCPSPSRLQNVDIVYEYQCNGPSRDPIIFPGTKATLKCKKFYEIHYSNEPGYRSVTCLENGEWDRPLFDCTPECGKVENPGTRFIIGGSIAGHAEFPWHVGIYRKREKYAWEQICGGTLVKPDLVVSAAHCFYDDTVRNVSSVGRFAVAAGKMYRSYFLPEYSAQKSFVKKIHIDDKYFGFEGNYALDIAFVRTNTSFTYTHWVKPICIDVDNKINLWPGRIGKVPGWGVADDGNSSDILRMLALPYIPHEDCIDAVPEDFMPSVYVDDKFCGGYLNGSSVCTGDSGGGLSFKSNGLWYLRGIVSVGPHIQSNDGIVCVSDSYTVFTNVSKHLEWIRSHLVRSAAEGRTFCALPEKPLNGGFEIDSRSELHVSVPGGEVPNGGSLVYSCDKGYTLRGSIDSTCDDGAWSRKPPICAIRIKCQPLRVPTNGHVVCKFKGNTVPCESNVGAGTRATVICARFYQIWGEHNSTHRDLLCNEDGEWDQRVPRCVPECGRLMNENQFTGNEVRFPWIVAIYYKDSISQKNAHRLDGSLVSPDLVITSSPGQLSDAINSGLRILVYAGESENTEYESSSPVQDVFSINNSTYTVEKKMVWQSQYLRYDGHYYDPDIAILRLATPFTLTTLVRPVCIDWGHRYEPDDIQLDKNLALLVSEFSAKPPTYRTYLVDRKLTFVQPDECRSWLRSGYKNEVKTLICHTTVHIGRVYWRHDVFSDSNGIWYLRGAVFHEIRDRDDQEHLIHAHINVGSHIDGIRSVFMQSAISAPMVNQSLAYSVGTACRIRSAVARCN